MNDVAPIQEKKQHETAKWGALSLLVLILITVVVVRITDTPKQTWGMTDQVVSQDISAASNNQWGSGNSVQAAQESQRGVEQLRAELRKIDEQFAQERQQMDTQYRQNLVALEKQMEAQYRQNLAVSRKQAEQRLPRSVRTLPYLRLGTGHWVRENIDHGDYIQLEDNSLWEVALTDRIYARSWLRRTDITVTEGEDLLYPYLLVNPDDNEVVRAKLIAR